MNIVALARSAAVTSSVIALASGVFGVLAVVLGEYQPAGRFALCAMVATFAAATLWLSVFGRPERSSAREAIALLILIWAGAPILAGIPFVQAADAPGFLNGYFHAVSAATTTGFPPNRGILEHASLVGWWNLIQWIGGGVTILAALIVMAAINVSGAGVHRSHLLTIDVDNLFGRLPMVAPTVVALYTLATVTCAALVMLGGAPVLDALCVAMAAVSTGGLALVDGQTSAAALPTGSLFGASVGLVFGALSFAMYWQVISGRWDALRDAEAYLFFGLAAFAFTSVLVIDPPFAILINASDGVLVEALYTFEEAARTLFEAIALVATAGWDAGPIGVSYLAAPMVMALITVGGAAISTAGGVKLRRVVMMSRQLGVELSQLAHPSSVIERGRPVSRPGSDVVFSIGVYFFAFAVVAAALTLALTWTGMSLAASGASAVVVLVNAGPALEPAVGHEARLITSTLASQVFACIGMVFGRLEIVAAFALLMSAFWRR